MWRCVGFFFKKIFCCCCIWQRMVWLCPFNSVNLCDVVWRSGCKWSNWKLWRAFIATGNAWITTTKWSNCKLEIRLCNILWCVMHLRGLGSKGLYLFYVHIQEIQGIRLNSISASTSLCTHQSSFKSGEKDILFVYR